MCHSAVDDGTDDLFCQEELEDSQSEDSFEVSAAQNANRPRADNLMLIFASANFLMCSLRMSSYRTFTRLCQPLPDMESPMSASSDEESSEMDNELDEWFVNMVFPSRNAFATCLC